MREHAEHDVAGGQQHHAEPEQEQRQRRSRSSRIARSRSTARAYAAGVRRRRGRAPAGPARRCGRVRPRTRPAGPPRGGGSRRPRWPRSARTRRSSPSRSMKPKPLRVSNHLIVPLGHVAVAGDDGVAGRGRPSVVGRSSRSASRAGGSVMSVTSGRARPRTLAELRWKRATVLRWSRDDERDDECRRRRHARCDRSGACSPWSRPAGRSARRTRRRRRGCRGRRRRWRRARRTLPSVNAASARSRWPCERLPWIAALRTPRCSSFLASASAPCFVRQNTIVGPAASMISAVTSTRGRRGRPPRTGGWRAVWSASGSEVARRVALVALHETVDRAVERGGEQQRLAGRRACGRAARCTAGRKPMSAMRSASSTTTISTSSRSTSRRSMRSVRRPGQATSTSTPRRSALNCAPKPAPP